MQQFLERGSKNEPDLSSGSGQLAVPLSHSASCAPRRARNMKLAARKTPAPRAAPLLCSWLC